MFENCMKTNRDVKIYSFHSHLIVILLSKTTEAYTVSYLTSKCIFSLSTASSSEFKDKLMNSQMSYYLTPTHS